MHAIEVTNAVTHGLGMLLTIFGGFFLLQYKKQDLEILGCSIYLVSLFVMYTSSTLTHSFFLMERTSYIFTLMDHASIYLLIAG
jgi:hemolysin III